MALIDKETIRAEIERRRNEWLAKSRLIKKGRDVAMYAAGKSSAYAEFLSLLDSLPEQPVEIHIDNPNIEKIDPSIKVETRTDGTGDIDGKALLYVADKSYKIGFRDGKASKEQPVEKTCKTCGFYENNCPFIRNKFIPYPNKVCKDYTYSVMKAQEQPAEGLEDEIKRYLREEHDRDTTVRDVARHFAEWMKAKMMKEAVEGEIAKDNRGNNVLRVGLFNNGFEIGDKVRVIVIKED